MEMKAGMKYETEIVVNEGMLANHNDPQLPAIELPAVFSTPSMINLMELTCEVEITEVVNGKKVTFAVNAYDENGLIGTGTHKRAVINKAAFNM